jgi:hypothetical protein
MGMKITPLTQKQAKAFITEHHRHLKASRGDIFRFGLEVDGQLVGAMMVGRPVARRLQDGYTLEVTRCAINGYHKGACSKMYAAAWRVGASLGYKRIITYTNQDESGASLRGAGWTIDNEHDLATKRSKSGWNNRLGRQQDLFKKNETKIRWIKGEPFPIETTNQP